MKILHTVSALLWLGVLQSFGATSRHAAEDDAFAKFIADGLPKKRCIYGNCTGYGSVTRALEKMKKSDPRCFKDDACRRLSSRAQAAANKDGAARALAVRTCVWEKRKGELSSESDRKGKPVTKISRSRYEAFVKSCGKIYGKNTTAARDYLFGSSSTYARVFDTVYSAVNPIVTQEQMGPTPPPIVQVITPPAEEVVSASTPSGGGF